MPKPPRWTPKPEDYRAILADQNPWHADGQVPASLSPVTERAIVARLAAAVRTDQPRRFRLVLGPRRVGKTTVMYQMVRRLIASGVSPRRLWWLRLDHPLLIQLPLGGLIKRVQQLADATPAEPVYLFLDEVTYSRQWSLWLKTAFDEQWPVRIVATSSAVAALRDQRMESGIGRWEEHHLPPYLFHEYLQLKSESVDVAIGSSLAETLLAVVERPQAAPSLSVHLRRFMFTGGFPELLLRVGGPPTDDSGALIESQRTLRADAVERVVWKDIPQAFSVDNPMAMERLLYTLAGQVGGLMSPDSICQTVRDITTSTFDRYVKYLELAYMIFTVQNFSPREESRQRRGRKVYFVDVAVRNAALQRGVAPLVDPTELGLMYENVAASHLHALALQGEGRLFYWRDGRREVDFVHDHPEQPLAIEIGSSSRHSREGLIAFAQHDHRARGRCYVASPGSPAPTAPNAASGQIGEVALEYLLIAAGLHAEAALFRRIGG